MAMTTNTNTINTKTKKTNKTELPTRPDLVTGHIYHLYNRGVAKQEIFFEDGDYLHFLLALVYYLEETPSLKLSLSTKFEKPTIKSSFPKKPLVEVLVFCLMPNHFHLLVKQLIDAGISTFIRRALNSYTRYYNVKHERVGTLFQGVFKASLIEDDNQLLQVSRYIHLNPFVSGLVDSPIRYQWSSYRSYLKKELLPLCHPELISDLTGSTQDYKEFVEDYAEYARTLHQIKNEVIEEI